MITVNFPNNHFDKCGIQIYPFCMDAIGKIPQTPLRLAAYLMLLSGVAHLLQLLILGVDDPDTVNGSLFGGSFLLVSLLLFMRPQIGLWVGLTWPFLLGLGALYRIIALSPTPMTFVFAGVDYLVVYLCAYCLVMKHKRG